MGGRKRRRWGNGGSLFSPRSQFWFSAFLPFFSCSPPSLSLCSLPPTALEELSNSPLCPPLVHFVHYDFLECRAYPVTVFHWSLGAFLPICHDSCWTLSLTPYHPPLHSRPCWVQNQLSIPSEDEGASLPWALSGCCIIILICVLSTWHGYTLGDLLQGIFLASTVKMHRFLPLYSWSTLLIPLLSTYCRCYNVVN